MKKIIFKIYKESPVNIRDMCGKKEQKAWLTPSPRYSHDTES